MQVHQQAFSCASGAACTGPRAQRAIFTADADVRALLSTVLLPLALYVIADASQVWCGGVLQGCGRQRQGMPVVLVVSSAVWLHYCLRQTRACALLGL